jgi:hypothetical protein
LVRTPQASLFAHLNAWFASEEEFAIGALQLWARTSFAALAVGLIMTAWFTLQKQEAVSLTDAEQMEQMEQIIFQKHFTD